MTPSGLRTTPTVWSSTSCRAPTKPAPISAGGTEPHSRIGRPVPATRRIRCSSFPRDQLALLQSDQVNIEALVRDDPDRGIFRVHRSTMTSADIFRLEQ